MKLKEILSQSFKYPLSNVKQLLILGILILSTILIIPRILAAGYHIRIIESSFEGSNELPPFNEWKKMTIDGFKYIVVLLVYLIVPGFIGILLSVFIGVILEMMNFGFSSSILIITFIIMLLIMVVPYFLSFMAVARMVKEDRLGAAFEFKEVWKGAKNFGYVHYITAVVVLILSVILVPLIVNIPKILQMGLITIYSVTILANLFIQPYLFGFRGKMTAIIYEEAQKSAPEIKNN